MIFSELKNSFNMLHFFHLENLKHFPLRALLINKKKPFPSFWNTQYVIQSVLLSIDDDVANQFNDTQFFWKCQLIESHECE